MERQPLVLTQAFIAAAKKALEQPGDIIRFESCIIQRKFLREMIARGERQLRQGKKPLVCP